MLVPVHNLPIDILVSESQMLFISDWIGDVAPRVPAVQTCESCAGRHGLALLEIAKKLVFSLASMAPAQFEFLCSLN